MSDIASDLKERFEYAAYFFQCAWEHDSNAEIVGSTIVRDKEKEDAEDQMIDTFEKLADSVSTIPPAFISKTEDLRASAGAGKYEAVLVEAIQNISPTSLPKDAAEFLESLNRSLICRVDTVQKY